LGVHSNGAFAQYAVLPEQNAWVHRNPVDLDVAAIFDPFGNAVHTALSFPVVGEDVLITGAGPIGIMAAAIVRFIGARNVVITDVNDYRLELARKMGATLALNVTRDKLEDAMKQLGMQEGFDVGLEMSGNAAALRDMLRTMHHGGGIAMLGIPPNEVAIDWNEVILKGLTIKGIYGRQMFETWYKMAALLQSGLNIRPVITHRLPYTQYQQAFEIMGKGQSGKVVMSWE
jgi:threonine 3-dehydrogenase